MSDDRSGGKEKRFSGEGQNPCKDYQRWKRWARAHLRVQRAKNVDPEAFGSILYCLLDATALKAFDRQDPDAWEVEGGEAVIFSILDGRFPEDEAHDKIGEVLDCIYDLRIEKNENTALYCGRIRDAFSAAEAEGISFPPVARGHTLLRAAKLTPEKKAIILAASRRSYEENDVAAAMRTTYPDCGSPRGRSPGQWRAQR
jgi:hypothetical protein